MTTVWVYTIICAKGLWCFTEHNFVSYDHYATEQLCYAAAAERYSFVLSHGWVAVCHQGRKFGT
jgi:hypothetical protein